jgi:predicted nucleic acid-binding protein
MTVLLDNTVLSNFAMVRRPDLVKQAFFEEVGTTEYAWQELLDGVALGKVPDTSWDWLVLVSLTAVEQVHFQSLAAHMGRGEASCLAVARERGYRLATDDKDARRLSRQLGISLTGTVGILAILVKQAQVPLAEGDRLLHEMIAAGYHSPVVTLADVLS